MNNNACTHIMPVLICVPHTRTHQTDTHTHSQAHTIEAEVRIVSAFNKDFCSASFGYERERERERANCSGSGCPGAV